MPRRIRYLFILLLCCSSGSAQEIIFQDTFVDNRHQWPLTQTRQLRLSLIQEGLEIRGKSAYEAQFISQKIPLDPQEDFEISLRITQTAGAKNMGFGLCWGAKSDHQDWQAFLISTNGKFTLLQKKRGQYRETKRWTESQNVWKQNEPNTLTIQKKGDKISFYLNDKIAFVSAALPLAGPRVGILMHGTMTLVVEELVISRLPQD